MLQRDSASPVLMVGGGEGVVLRGVDLKNSTACSRDLVNYMRSQLMSFSTTPTRSKYFPD